MIYKNRPRDVSGRGPDPLTNYAPSRPPCALYKCIYYVLTY